MNERVAKATGLVATRRRRGGSALPAAAFLAAALAVLAPPAPLPAGAGVPATLDLAAMKAHVAAGAADEGLPKPARKAHAALGRALAKPPTKGLFSDYAALKAVSKACAKVLADDGTLRDLLDDALDDGMAGLAAKDADAVQRSGLLQVEASRSKVLASAARAREKRSDAAEALAGADEAGHLRLARGAAKGFDKAAALADRLRAKEAKATPSWALPLQDLGGALLSVWGESGADPTLYAVGAADAGGPQFLVLHPGAEAWLRHEVGPTGDLWWVTGVPGDGVWASGSEGRVVRFDPASRTLEDRSTGADAILYGTWGSGPTDVWAVGGDPDGDGPRPALLHWDGEGWETVAHPPEADGKVLFKVWGTSATDAWACGQGGLVMHWDGVSWAAVDSDTGSTLLTVHGPASGGSGLVTAVGGGGVSAVIVERALDGTWSSEPAGGGQGGGGQVPPGTAALNGVHVPATGAPWAVGFTRTVLRRQPGGGWVPLSGVPVASRDLHAVWVDDAGNAVMVGGNLFSLQQGTMATHGTRFVPSTILPAVSFRDRVQPLLYLSCATAGCHLSPFSNLGLEFDDAATTLATNVVVPSSQSPLLRVAPGRPSQSYLVHKLAGTHLEVGGRDQRMPLEGAYFSDEDLDAVRAWIAGGARDDGP